MKKTTNKTKSNLGCKKISAYFKVQGANSNKKVTPAQVLEEIIILNSDEEDDDETDGTIANKRKFDNTKSTLSPPLKKSSARTNPVPSTSGIGPRLSVKQMKDLLSPPALKVYNSLTEKVGKVLDEIEENMHVTPEKKVKDSVDRKTPLKSAEKATGRNQTPKKLFLQSPRKLNEFNVDVLKNFVKITPKKANNRESDEKKCFQVQTVNETTPEKGKICTSSFSSTDKVRAQLDFSSCTAALNQEISSELVEGENEDLNLSDIIFDNSWNDDMFEDREYNLDLSKSQHCLVVSLDRRKIDILLTVQSTKSNECAICRLKDIWFDTKLNVGDTINITAVKTKENEWLVDNQNGLLVYEPDYLISATSIAGGVFCKRKVVFTEKFRGFDPTNKYMIVGSIVHSLLQDTLVNEIYQLEDIQSRAEEILKKPDYISDIYACGEPYEAIKQEVYAYIPKIHTFIMKYVQKKKARQQPASNADWKGIITKVEDIEENIWCPSLGVKGKVDITISNGNEIMPVEVKSGRATVSVEHRGQVLLYIMMMNKLGYEVSSGLLLYLKEGILKEVPPTASEKAGLMMLRNELAFYLSKQPKIVKDGQNVALEHPQVPTPIYHKFCESCPYNTICIAHARHFNEDISGLKPLKTISDELADLITPEHIDYFMKWSGLLTVEMSGGTERKNLKDIYTLSPNERKKKGKCLINLQLQQVLKQNNRLYVHTFKESKGMDTNFLSSGFTDHAYVVVSCGNRPAIASGFITRIAVDLLEVTLERDLTIKYKNQLFHVDSYDSTSLLTSSMASLGLILDTTEQGNKLRHIIVDRSPPKFQNTIPKAVVLKAKPILKRLNQVQRRAVLKAIAAEDYFLIKGMPGTGKTATIVALIELLVDMGKTVLITSHTHSAVDNVCLRLVKYGVKLMRLGNKNRIHKELLEFSEDKLSETCTTPEQLESVYNSVSVVAVTCLGASHSLLSRRTFDICIVDESIQVVQCSMFRPIFASKTFVLIGDPDQLSAVIQNKDALALGMDESLFERLDSEKSRVSLNLNYRMNEPITALANALTYNGELLIGTEEIAKATLQIPNMKVIEQNYKQESWLMRSLNTSLDYAVQFIDTGPTWNLQWSKIAGSDESDKYVNVYEAAVIYHLVKTLLKGGVAADHIGIIATYRAQVLHISTILGKQNVEINTVDQYQGKDKHIIIYSCSKSVNDRKEWKSNQFDLLEGKRRLNVAITRAKHKLIIVGDWNTLKNYSTFRAIKNNLEKNTIQLLECNDFSWSDILELV